MLTIKKAEFIRSIADKKGYFNKNGTPEFALVGKSNVGKSSLINMLTNNGKLAKTSKQPGKTRLVNYFLLNDSFYMVDLPGYGFALASKKEQETWERMMTDYFDSAKENLKAVILLVDIRHEPSENDKLMMNFIEQYGFPYAVVATKADKIAKSKRKNECVKIRRELPTSYSYNIIPVSSEEKYGKDELLAEIQRLMEQER